MFKCRLFIIVSVGHLFYLSDGCGVILISGTNEIKLTQTRLNFYYPLVEHNTRGV